MREISPAVNLSADAYLRMLPAELQRTVHQIRSAKENGARPKPSANVIDHSSLLSARQRGAILDAVADLVDENLCGRSDMCTQFADLLSRSLSYLGLSARPVVGNAIYYDSKRVEIFRWRHAWVRVGKELVDGNVDSLAENPMVPSSVNVKPYWGPINETPSDRKLRPKEGVRIDPDTDVADVWWPDMRAWLDQTYPTIA